MKNAYRQMESMWKSPKEMDNWKAMLIRFRKEPTIRRVERPTRLGRAREFGYKAKQGFVIVRVKVPRGRRKTPKPQGGRRPKASGRFYPLLKSFQVVAEERAQRKFPNLRMLNSYWVGEDGMNKWYECIMVDPNQGSIKSDKDINWIVSGKHKGRANRGLTSSGRKARGLRHKGKMG
ncbi:MAG TPA: 50S ribosomal protein L15e [archaeon]|nr:50S ribosomal protein L15e [archaeon]